MTVNANDQDDYLTAEEIGVRLRLKADTIVGWARRGRIPVIRLSKHVIRFRLNDVLAALAASQSESTAEAEQ
jgi:excisionase family DNA binding protein